MRLLILCVLLVSWSCRERALDANMIKQPPAGSTNNEEAIPKVVAEGMPPIKIELSELFVLNPVGNTRSTEQINLAHNSTVLKTIVMATEKKSRQQAVTAKSRSWHSRQVTQTGSNGQQRTDERQLGTDKGLLDLLLVVDASGSMQITHEKLKDKLSSLLHDIENSNWQINIIDVDDHQTCDNTIINKNNEGDYRNKLDALKASAGNNPNFNERTLQKAEAALLGSCNAWLRPQSTLAAVIITDEDHQCTNPGADDNRGSDTNSFLCGTAVDDFIKAFRNLREYTGLYGIFFNSYSCGDARAWSSSWSSSWSSAWLRSWYRPCFRKDDSHLGAMRCWVTNPCFAREDGDKYLANYLKEEGKFDGVIDIFSADYNVILKNIAQGIKGKLQNQLTLTSEPDRGAAVTVTVDGTTKTPESDFNIEGKILTFLSNPGGNSVVIQYALKGGVKPFISTMTVESQADMNTLIVSVVGSRLQKNTHYTVSGNTVTLTNATKDFPAGAVANLQWQRQQRSEPPQKEFSFAHNYEIVVGTVSISGYTASRYRVVSNPNKIIFNQGQEPAYGARLNILYEHYHIDKLTYPHNYSGTYSITAVSCAAVTCSLSGSNVVFRHSDFQRDRSVKVTLTVQGLQHDRRPLPQHYVVDSLKLELGDKICTEKQLVITNSEIRLKTTNAQDNGCDLLAALDNNIDQDMTLSFLPFTPNQEIEVSMDNLFEYIGYSKEYWEVFVDGKQQEEGKDYTIDGRKITFTGNYPPDTNGEVKIFIDH